MNYSAQQPFEDEIIKPKDARKACTWKPSTSLANQE